MPKRPCLDCGTPAHTTRGRCPDCHADRERQRSRQRGTTTQQGYGRAYQRARAEAGIGGPGTCWCCHTWTPRTTADHWPPLATGHPDHTLLPACPPCNYGHCAQHRWTQQLDVCPQTMTKR